MADFLKPLLLKSEDRERTTRKRTEVGYWPEALRIPWLIAVTCFVLALIAALEVAARTLPMNPKRHYLSLSDLESKLNKRAPTPATTEYSTSYADTTTVADTTMVAYLNVASTSSVAPSRTSAKSSSSSDPPALDAGPGMYIDVLRTSSKAASATPDVYPFLPSGSFVALKSTSSFPEHPTKTKSAYVTIVITSSIGASTPITYATTTDENAYVALQITSSKVVSVKPAQSPAPSAYVTIKVTSSIMIFPTDLTPANLGTKPDAYVQIASAVSVPAVIQDPISYIPADAYVQIASVVSVPAVIQDPISYVPAAVTLTGSSSPTTAHGTFTSAFVHVVLSTSSAQFSTVITGATSPSAYVHPSGTISASGTAFSQGTGDLQSQQATTIVLTWPVWKIFVGNYLPVLVAVILKLVWTPIDANARLMQPFINLARPTGASSQSTFFSSYLSQSRNPVRLLLENSWLSLSTAANVLLVMVIAPLSSEAIFLDTNYGCKNPDLTSDNPCWPPRISADPYIIRVLQGLLALISVVCICVIFFAVGAPQPLSMDPSSLAGVATLLHHPILLQDLRNEDPDAATDELRRSLPNRKYALQHYQQPDRQWRSGIAPVNATDYAVVDGSGYKPKWARSGWLKGKRSRSFRDVAVRVISTLLSVVMLGLILGYYKDHADDGFNRFFNSNSFGPRFVLTALATIASATFAAMQHDVVLAAPFRRLGGSPRTAASTILLRKFSLPHISTFTFARHAYIFPALFSLVAALTDILIIFAAVIPYSPGRVWIEFLISTYVCIGILGLMIIAIVGLIFWKGGVNMPRKPDTLASVMSYLCTSRLLDDIAGYGAVEGKEMEEVIRRNGVRYMYGRFEGVDGIVRWMVDTVR